MSGGPVAGDSLRERNLETFRLHFPEQHAKLISLTDPATRIVEEDGIAVDIDLGTGRLYKQDGRALAEKQARDFIATPRQVGYLVSDAMTGDSPVSKRLFSAVVDSARRNRAQVESGPPLGHAGYLFIFGLGLGHHLPLLVENLEVDQVVVVETIDEFVLHSLSVVDWTAMIATCEAKDAKLSLVCGEMPADLIQQVQDIIVEHGELALDGSHYYRHYPSWALDKAFEAIVNNVPLRMIQRGYFEDERKMIWNAVTNLEKYDTRLIPAVFAKKINVPAFMVMSGPSVDNDIEYIKEFRDKAIIFSGGSSLQILLAHGIIPDYHVELENVVQVWDFLQHILELNPDKFPDGRFTGIKLIASVTVNPRVTPLFDETYYFFRDSVSSSMCFGGDIPLMSGVAPNIANTVVAAGARLGFRHIYMFGMDCGWRDESAHHSKNTAYYTSKEFKTEKVAGDQEWPGNFGGTISSNMLLAWTRDMLEQKVNKFGLNAYNCSDGALIKGAVPKLAEAIELPDMPLTREQVYEEVRIRTTPVEHGTYLKDYDFDALIAEVDLYERLILDLCDQSLDEGKGFRWMLRSLTVFNREAPDKGYLRPRSVFVGATMGMAKCGCIFLNRIEDGDKAKAVFKDFVAEYRQIHVEMAEEVRDIFRAAQTWLNGGPEPSWASGLQIMPGYTF